MKTKGCEKSHPLKNKIMKKNQSVEKLEEPKIHIKEAIKENTVIHCETEEEAERILDMAHELGYRWWIEMNYKNNPEWGVYKSKMCYDLFGGSYSHYDYFKNKNYTIIPSTQIGGNHYSDMVIQPIEFIHKNNLSFIQGNVIKYVCRYKSKGDIQDLNKAKHYIDLLIEFEEENN